ncbi:putative Nuclear mRNA splicing factor-associated protein [Taphrina deformans PYCC 5710]|uniref:Nuclear mRNA splicing factor-associated protein n=1 Tax=Taphrina deformans (strain PYCC 5710 / ATCC 11124 / CBS 356.35 / IMI 108563 / JCM 9778 / NBRC 8474) TaxID=1097556 RepID=S0BE52_TAPDE|nr:putative Nuclear mRNA splicing factor-associated protein [Taphrina deformans PYCC 5710]|eukprot:CCG81546.1 putative Nuclear mRNA splicing factor-associated protein [Taphrina deformans PYCC 5710]
MSTRDDPEFNKVSGRWEYEDESGQTYEKDPVTEKWIEVVDEEKWKAQQAAYSVPGVDEESTTDVKPKKRKAQETFTGGVDQVDGDAPTTKSKAAKKEKPATKVRHTAVYVQNLAEDTTPDELASLFSKCGILAEDPITGLPRIKMYKDKVGKLKGDALVIYFREESVSLAVTMLDDTSLRGDSRMLKVSKATFEHKGNKGDDPPPRQVKDEAVKKKGANRAGKLRSKLADWSDEDEKEIPQTTKFDKVVILKGMFSLHELESDPTLLLDLKEDVRDECARLGEVTNVVLYDKEPDGIMSVRFKDESHAEACIKVMHGRFFGGRQVVAELFDGKLRYLKTGKTSGGDDEGDDEAQRLEQFGAWLEGDN